MNFPSRITIGDSIAWLDQATSDNLGNSLDSSQWTLNYAIRGATSLTLTATQNGTGWKTAITASQSTQFIAGTYYWQAYVTKGSERVTLSSGQFQAVVDLASINSAYDGRSQARKDLEAVQAALRALVSNGAVQEYVIGGRSIKKMSSTQLLELEARLKVDVVREEKAQTIANGLGNPHNLYVRFR